DTERASTVAVVEPSYTLLCAVKLPVMCFAPMVRVAPPPVLMSVPSEHTTVMLYTPGATEAVVDTVSVVLGNVLPPFEVKVAGAKLAVAPGGRPVTVNVPLTVPLPILAVVIP